MAEESTARVLFVCLGNICRSPTAEAVLRSLAAQRGLAEHLEIESAGTGDWHVGHPPDQRAIAAAAERGIELAGTARQVEPSDLERFDLLIAMDRANLAELRDMAERAGIEAELALLREFDRDSAELEVPDPYYDEDRFDHVLDVVTDACHGLLDHLEAEHL